MYSKNVIDQNVCQMTKDGYFEKNERGQSYVYEKGCNSLMFENI